MYAAYAVALPFLRDFEKSGIHLPNEQRNQFVELSGEIIQLGRKFLQNSSETVGMEVEISYAEIEESMGTGFAQRVFRNGKNQKIDSSSWEGRVIGRQHPSEEIRKKLFVANNTPNESHIEVLEELLMTRAELAELVGRESWGDVTLDDKMAKNPENVMGFLKELNRVNKPLAKKDLEILKAAKKSHTGAGRFTGVTINAWDRDFYTDYSADTSNLPDISPFFSVGTCFQGLSKLFTSLYGIRFEIEELTAGEAWNGQVRKLKVIDEDQGRIGTIYCDLFARAGKPPGAAHYTVRCSRRIDDDNERADFGGDGLAIIEGVGISPHDIQGLNVDGVRWRGREGVYQEPIIALVCGFGSENQQKGPALLQWHEVETLFHEMGHAIHCVYFSVIVRDDC